MTVLTRLLVFKDGTEVEINSSNPRQLYKQYCSKLRNKKHPNKFLQDLYDKYGLPILKTPS